MIHSSKMLKKSSVQVSLESLIFSFMKTIFRRMVSSKVRSIDIVKIERMLVYDFVKPCFLHCK